MKAKSMFPNYRKVDGYGCCGDCAKVDVLRSKLGRRVLKCQGKIVGAYMVCDEFDDGLPEAAKQLNEELHKESTPNKPYVSFEEYQQRLRAKMSNSVEVQA
ncbi:MAG: hypothetical protein PHO32_07050 [Candidatus Cloacimonetes bacterium]|nr:hypothetical protein [Candidatus Cloacimonadota bacterium]